MVIEECSFDNSLAINFVGGFARIINLKSLNMTSVTLANSDAIDGLILYSDC